MKAPPHVSSPSDGGWYETHADSYEWDDTLSDGSDVRVTAYDHAVGIEIKAHEYFPGFGWSERRIESESDYDRLHAIGEERLR